MKQGNTGNSISSWLIYIMYQYCTHLDDICNTVSILYQAWRTYITLYRSGINTTSSWMIYTVLYQVDEASRFYELHSEAFYELFKCHNNAETRTRYFKGARSIKWLLRITNYSLSETNKVVFILNGLKYHSRIIRWPGCV